MTELTVALFFSAVGVLIVMIKNNPWANKRLTIFNIWNVRRKESIPSETCVKSEMCRDIPRGKLMANSIQENENWRN